MTRLTAYFVCHYGMVSDLEIFELKEYVVYDAKCLY